MFASASAPPSAPPAGGGGAGGGPVLGGVGGLDTELSQKVEFFFSARGMRKMDLLSNSDPFAVLYSIGAGDTLTEIGRTEVIMDTQNPDFTTQFLATYHFEEIQRYRVVLYDKDSEDLTDLSKHDLLGSADFQMGTLMGSRGQALQITLTKDGNTNNHGKLIVRAEQVAECNDVAVLHFHATRKLANKDGFFSKSDPFICIHRVREDSTWQRVWQTEVVPNNLLPTWAIIRIPVQRLCQSDMYRPLRFEIYDHDSDGTHDYMGSFETNLSTLIENVGRDYPVIEEKKKGKRGYRDSGAVALRMGEIQRVPSLVDYLRGGMEISLMVAIDFTGSNGDPRDPSSLHYINPTGALNQYQQAIVSVGNIVEEYDADHKIPVYGFGARVNNVVSHCFPVYSEVEVEGVQGVLQAYSDCLSNVALSGPTLFSPILSAATAKASEQNTQESQKYVIMLIICDGIINDMENTIDALVAASVLPLSIIIVGVGNADFTDMNRLDADDEKLRASTGDVAVRDIVQFVPFRDYAASTASRLAADVLREVPDQVISYMQHYGFVPNPPIPPPTEYALPPPEYASRDLSGAAHAPEAGGSGEAKVGPA